MSVAELLHRAPLFADLREDELTALAGCLHRRVFAREMVLFHKGSPAQSLYIIESGAIRSFALSRTGQEITLDVYGPGECFGETVLLDGNRRSTGAMALETTVIYALPRSEFLRLVELHPEVARRVMALLAYRLDRAIAYAESLAFLDVPGRVAAVLLGLAARSGPEGRTDGLHLHLTQSDLATWCAASREMVNKVLNTYREQGLIQMTGHAIQILDSEGLRSKLAG